MKVEIERADIKELVFIPGNLVIFLEIPVLVTGSCPHEDKFSGVDMGGVYSETWTKASFELFKGEITLTQ